jgi:Na+/melibiose symporter-like transporter
MELDELKEAWTALDNRLKRNEELKENIILEMMKSKAGKLVNRFIAMEIISVVLIPLVIPACINWLDRNLGKYLAGDICMFLAIMICTVYFMWGIFKIHGLMKFDLAKNVGNNIIYVNKYNIQLKREKKIFSCFLWPVLCLLVVLYYAEIKATMFWWSLMICALIAISFLCYWLYKIYDKNIDSILRSLDEISELKEE